MNNGFYYDVPEILTPLQFLSFVRWKSLVKRNIEKKLKHFVYIIFSALYFQRIYTHFPPYISVVIRFPVVLNAGRNRTNRNRAIVY